MAQHPDMWKGSLPLWHRELMERMTRESARFMKTQMPRYLVDPGTIRFIGADFAGPITGLKPDFMIIDDPQSEHNQGAKVKTPKTPKKDYNTVGVRFIYGHDVAKIYTYKIRKGAKVHLGQEVVVPSSVVAQSVAVVVEIHKTPQDTGLYNYLFVTGKVAPL